MTVAVAYLVVVIGLTQFAGMLLGSLISLPIVMLLPPSTRPRIAPLLEFFNGAAALAAALPLIAGGWLTFYFFSYGKKKVAWIAAIIGVMFCWIIYRIVIMP